MGHKRTMGQKDEGKETVESCGDPKQETLSVDASPPHTPLSASVSIGDRSEDSQNDDSKKALHLESSLAMLNVGSLMREQDADLLESIHMNGGSTGMTPVLQSSEAAKEVSPLNLSQEAVKDRTEHLADLFQKPDSKGSAPDSKPQPLETIAPSSFLAHTHSDAPLSDLSFLPPSSSALNRRTLSGEVYQNDDAKHSSSESCMRRTDSKERRINEAAQFAEAVGDLPLQEQNSLRIIDDGDDVSDADDDDDDDDAREIHVERRGIPPVLTKRSVQPHETTTAEASLGSDDHVASGHGHQRTSSTAVSVLTQGSDVPPETPVKNLRKLSRPQRAASMDAIDTIQDKTPPRSTEGSVWTAASSTTDSIGRNATFLAQLPSSTSSQDFVYKGIRANPPEIVKRGTTRGNYAQLHRKAWLEVSDKYHRYGKHLRMYYRYWESVGCPTNFFFEWLDSKGEAAGKPLPEIPECPRSQLDSDTVLYITNPEVTQNYALKVVADVGSPDYSDEEDAHSRGRIYDVDGDPVVTGPEGWIFVLRDNVLYGSQKITSVTGHSKERFHHSSFFGGKAVASAGIFITNDKGYLTRLYPHSGHYRPGEAHVQRILFYLFHEGIDLRTFEMDMQQILHVSRDKLPTVKSEATVDKKKECGEVKAEKKKKVESLFLMSAVLVACFLANKARFIGEGIFSQIHQIRKADVASVMEALEVIDGGGFWRRKKQNPSFVM